MDVDTLAQAKYDTAMLEDALALPQRAGADCDQPAFPQQLRDRLLPYERAEKHA